MENIIVDYLGESANSDKYHEMRKIIEKDLERLKYLISDYKDSWKLSLNLSTTIDELRDESNSLRENLNISLDDNYLFFNYYYDDFSYNVVIKRNYKELYFIDYDLQNCSSIIKQYKIKDRVVKLNIFIDERNILDWSNSFNIDMSILKLNKKIKQ